ncbi:MAG: hypothetical protein ABIQ27_12845 [Flavobacterium sp.]|uniref:hypothetical protein n=1 Tax=Flavobacterium sp. TaxID=239 RepID=UPI0032637B09
MKIIYKTILLLNINLFVLILSSCSKTENDNEKLIKIVKSEKFIEYFQLCNQNKDSIIIYNNLNLFESITPFEICDKVVIIEKSNIKLDFNNSLAKRENKVLLYKYEENNNLIKLYFIHVASNAYYNVSIDDENLISGIETGAY